MRKTSHTEADDAVNQMLRDEKLLAVIIIVTLILGIVAMSIDYISTAVHPGEASKAVATTDEVD